MIKSASRSSITNDQKYRSMLAGTVPSSEYLITTTVLGSSTPSVTFDVSSFAGVYKHLQVVAVAQTPDASFGDNYSMRFNGDSGNNYSSHRLYGQSPSTVGSTNMTSSNAFIVGRYGPNTSNSFMPAVIDILDPFSSTKNTTVKSLHGSFASDANFIMLASGAWYNTSPVTSITIIDALGGRNFAAGSRFSLYGVTA